MTCFQNLNDWNISITLKLLKLDIALINHNQCINIIIDAYFHYAWYKNCWINGNHWYSHVQKNQILILQKKKIAKRILLLIKSLARSDMAWTWNFMIYNNNFYDNIYKFCMVIICTSSRAKGCVCCCPCLFHNFIMMNNKMFHYDAIHRIYNVCVGTQNNISCLITKINLQ